MTKVKPHNGRVISLRVKNIAIEVYQQVDETSLRADALIATVATKGTWAKRTGSPINAAIRRVAGGHYHDRLTAIADFKPMTAIGIAGDSRKDTFGSVIFVNGTHPIPSALQAAFECASDEERATVVLPLAAFATTDSKLSDDKFFSELAFELGLLLENEDFPGVKRIKLIHPRDTLHLSGRICNALARGAASSVKNEKPKHRRPTCNVLADFGTIDSFNVDAVVICVRSNGSSEDFGVLRELECLSRAHFHDQLAGKKLQDGDIVRASGKEGQDFGFKDVIFVVNDGKKSNAEYIESALRFADDNGLKTLTLPLLSFVGWRDADKRDAHKPVFNDCMEGAKNFLTGDWKSLEIVMTIAPLSSLQASE